MKFQFAYQFKRGDTCDYCGTVFGYPLCGLAIVDKELALSARAGLELSAQALEKARNIADNYAAGKICPKCGRPTPEAYVSACRRGAIFYAWAAPLLGGVLATRVFEEEPAFFYGCAAWAFCWAWFRIYLAWPFWIGKGTADDSEGVEIWGERPECARGEVLEAEERRWLLRKMAAPIAAAEKKDDAE